MLTAETAAAQLRVGAQVAGKYRLVRLLGMGGMGAVYEAEHAVTGRRVALKVLHAEHTAKKGFAERFLREANSASKIGHPGIVDVLDAGADADGTLYLALELLHGTDLAGALARGPMDLGTLLRIARELLVALEAAHAQRIVHRDLKPENVFLARDADGTTRVKLLDFGIAKQLGEADAMRLTSTGTVLGTPYYMSPEQARGKSIDGRSDLWSLGAVLFDAITGDAPFPGENYNEVLAAILTDPIPSIGARVPALPAAVVVFVDRALTRDREERWSSATAMREALEGVLATEPAATLAALHTVPRHEALPSPSGIREATGDPSPVMAARSAWMATSVDRRTPTWLPWAGVVAALTLAAVLATLVLVHFQRATPLLPTRVLPVAYGPTPTAAPTPNVPVAMPLAPVTPPLLAPVTPPPVAPVVVAPPTGPAPPAVGTSPRGLRRPVQHPRDHDDTLRPQDPRRTYE